MLFNISCFSQVLPDISNSQPGTLIMGANTYESIERVVLRSETKEFDSTLKSTVSLLNNDFLVNRGNFYNKTCL